MQPRVKILLAYLVILSLGLAISATIFVSGRHVSNATTTLIEDKLPRLQVINELYLAIIERERLLYEYYATTDSEKILPQLSSIDQRFSAFFRQIEIAFPNSEAIEKIRYGDKMVRKLTQQLDENFQQTQVDWDAARDQLAQLSDTGRKILPFLEALVAQVNQEAYISGEETRQSTELSTRLVISFSIFVIIIAAFVGYYVNRYITETLSRRRLAMFAERSPNPIMSFNWQGQLTYSNPACFELMKQQGNYSLRAESLLVEDFQQRLLSLQKSKQNHAHWISHTSDDCILQFSLSLLRDLDTCHLYLEDITQRTQAENQLKFEAYHDILTELPNRRFFNDQLNTLVSNPQQPPFALLLIHIDRFDLVTSSAGFKTGDLLIKAVTYQQFCHNYCSLNLDDKLYRLDSNKFSLLLEQLPEHEFAEHLARDLKKELANLICVDDKQFHLTLSIGISHYPNNAGITEAVSEGKSEALLANADAALTRVKADGGDDILCYDQDIHDKEQAWIAIERDLRSAIEQQELILFFQAKIKAKQHHISGVESLIRWKKSNGKMISPAEFIPVAEQTGLIITIGDWVIQQAFQQLKHWQSQGLVNNDFSIAINLSAKQFQHPDFIPNIKRYILDADIEPEYIELEITESLLINNIDKSIRIMEQLKDIGFKLSIDDFGTGYSSLSYLKQFPIDKLKIDRAFVMDIEHNNDDKVLAKSIVDLAHNLNLSVVAEGVENKQQLEILEHLGAEEIQGFYFSKPKPAAEIEDEFLTLV